MDYKPSFVDQLDMNYISHHGIKGQKWGVRRYQNPDGSLTPAGEKRYKNSKKLYKDLKKQVRKKRGEVNDKSNRFMTMTPIGEHSEKYLNDIAKKRKAYENSPEYKKWSSDYDKFQKKWDKTFSKNDYYDIDLERQYNAESKEMFNKRPKKDFNDPYDAHVRITMNGKKYAKKYLNGAGKDLSMAYIKDLGYSDDVAKKMVDDLIKSGQTLGMI